MPRTINLGLLFLNIQIRIIVEKDETGGFRRLKNAANHRGGLPWLSACQSFNLRRAWSDQGYRIPPRCWKSKDSSKLGRIGVAFFLLPSTIVDMIPYGGSHFLILLSFIYSLNLILLFLLQLLALARKNGHIELVNPLNGDVCASVIPESAVEDPIAGLYLFKKQHSEMSSRSCTLLTCTAKGNAALRSIEVTNSPKYSTCNDPPTTWNVCTSGDVLCSAVDGSESHAIFGGKGIEVNLWNLEKCSKIWAAKPPPKNNLDIFTPTWFTAATFLGEEDHRKIVAGTNNHQVRLYDASAQRRPVISVDFRESPIKAVTGDPDGHTIYFGTGSGDLASVDIRTGKVLGCFLGKCSGSIRSIVRHPELPLIVSCGLDRYLRFWDVKTRQLLSAVFLKQHLTSVVIDSNFSDEVPAVAAVNPPANEEQVDLNDNEDDTSPQLKKKKSSKEGKQKRKSKKTSNVTVEDDDNCIAVNSPSDEEELANLCQDEDDASPPVKKKKALKEDKQNKKSKKKSKATVEEEDYSTAGNFRSDEVHVKENEGEDDVSPTVKRKKALKEGNSNSKLKSKKKSKKTVVDEEDN